MVKAKMLTFTFNLFLVDKRKRWAIKSISPFCIPLHGKAPTIITFQLKHGKISFAWQTLYFTDNFGRLKSWPPRRKHDKLKPFWQKKKKKGVEWTVSFSSFAVKCKEKPCLSKEPSSGLLMMSQGLVAVNLEIMRSLKTCN